MNSLENFLGTKFSFLLFAATLNHHKDDFFILYEVNVQLLASPYSDCQNSQNFDPFRHS